MFEKITFVVAEFFARPRSSSLQDRDDLLRGLLLFCQYIQVNAENLEKFNYSSWWGGDITETEIRPGKTNFLVHISDDPFFEGIKKDRVGIRSS